MRFDPRLLSGLLNANTAQDIESVMSKLPVVSPEEYSVDYEGPKGAWRANHLHWIPVGRDRGNGGRVKLAGQPTNPIAERLVNGMEAIIELERLREVRKAPDAAPPTSPRDAVARYFGLPRLDAIPAVRSSDERRRLLERVDKVRDKLSVRIAFDKKEREFAVVVEDRGMGQTPDRVHETLLSLGHTDKADKPYMIGVFGQGGSSAFQASAYSVVMSRRAPELLGPSDDNGLGWTIVRQIQPKGRRDHYFAYLACSPEGRVPTFEAKAANSAGFQHGARFAHIKYNFGGAGAAVTRLL
jgi:hypothetical protein